MAFEGSRAVTAALHATRRARVLDAMTARQASHGGAAVLLVPSAPVFVRNNDVEHEYRQDSDLHYLTGFSEPESVLVLDTRGRTSTLFVRPRDKDREIWDGPRAGVDGVRTDFGIDRSFTIQEFDAELPKLLGDCRRVYTRLGVNRAFDEKLFATIEGMKRRQRTGVGWPTEFVDSATLVHEMRLVKDDGDLRAMRTAADITREAHERVMAAAKPGAFEYEMEAILLDTFRRRGAERPAYGSIVGSGPNATILHYRSNDRRMEDGDLLLVDAGAEFEYLASDVTRTFPVNGRFSKPQRAIYEIVLEAQLASIAKSTVGATMESVHAASVEVITRGLVKLGLLTGDVGELVAKEAYKPFYMHRTGHWLGMDVHDVGTYYLDGKPRPFAPGVVTTVEPGIYIGRDYDAVPAEWRGIGVRIEDDILVTSEGPVNLTAAIPKTVEEVERACSSSTSR
ncbi:MAG: aminopeptidase P N-terminal domain-containing protein [Polyangiaceae bacterium]